MNSPGELPNLFNAPLLREWSSPEISPLAAMIDARQNENLPFQDFITANPYDHGFRFNADLLQEIMGKATADALRYQPDSLGQPAARQAVANYHGGDVLPGQVALTPGTSMAYFALFRLLARSGGEVLCPAPTYPLFDDLAKIAGLGVRRYHLQKTSTDEGITRWVIDPDELAFQLTPRTCAIVLVSPHNPTGTIINPEEMQGVCSIANKAGVPLILDEVFRNYCRDNEGIVARPGDMGANLSFTLNGLSKSHYLPGIKAGWIVIEGHDKLRSAVTNSLEYLLDSFLPVQEITQAALPSLLRGGCLTEAERLSRLQRVALSQRLSSTSGWNVSIPEAGPYICLPLSREDPEQNPSNTIDQAALEDRIVRDLLNKKSALFHPGHYYAFPEPALVATIYNEAAWPSQEY